MKLTPKEEFKLAAKTVAEGFDGQFPEAELDGEYTETGYSDLKREVRDAGTWAEFHAEAKRVLDRMRGE